MGEWLSGAHTVIELLLMNLYILHTLLIHIVNETIVCRDFLSE